MRGEHVVKPRTLLWEQLLLSAKSPLRRALRELAATSDLGAGAFEFLPTLGFKRANARAGGEVERVQLSPLRVRSAEQRRELGGVLGRALALFSWLGLSDLHWENLVLGADAEGRTVFGPLDVEMLLGDLRLPTETKLLPDADPEYAVLCQHAAGARRVLPFLGKPIEAQALLAMLAQYRATLAALDAEAGALAAAIAGVPGFAETPIRVCLRSTGDYVNAATQPLWPPLLDAEAEQLARGDIPYFFRFYGAPGIHYFDNRELTRHKTLPGGRNMPKNEPLLDVKRGLRSPRRKQLREDGLFAVIGAFDHPDLSGEHELDGYALRLSARRMRLTLPDGAELTTGRDLSEFVSSVYLPCACGEVKTALVPPASVCRAADGSV
jgi:hypothetical protein